MIRRICRHAHTLWTQELICMRRKERIRLSMRAVQKRSIQAFLCRFRRGWCGLIVSKSGLNVKHGILSDGLIDSGYTGTIRVKLYNHGTEPFAVDGGMKISQLVVVPCMIDELKVVEEFPETKRGTNGFGSTGA